MTLRRQFIALCASSAAMISPPLFAETLTWDADPTTTNAQDGAGIWDTVSTNWMNISTNVAWNNANPDSATFGNGAVGGIVTLAEPITISNLTFANSGYTISGTNTLTLSSAPTNIILMNANATIDAAIGGGSWRKAGNSILTLGGANTFTGNVTISAGILTITNGNALGVSPLVTVANGQKLRLSGGITVTGTTVSINGNGGTDSSGALQSGVNSTNTWAGGVVLAADQARIGAITNATLVVSGVIDHNGTANGVAFRSSDGSAWVVASGANTYSGKTALVVGNLRLAGGDNRLPTTTVLEIGNTSNQGTTLADLNGVNQQIVGLTDLGNSMSKAVTNSSVTLSTLTLSGTSTFSTANGTVLAGNLALVKGGTGTQILRSAVNTYSGGTTINGGTLALGTDGANNQSSRGLGNGPATINAGGTLRLGGSTGGNTFSISNHVTLAGGTIWAQEGIQRFTNASFTVGPAGGTLITVNGDKDLWIDDTLLGSGPLTVDNSSTTTGGFGTVRFNGVSNSYNGTITVNPASAGFLGGRISFQRDSALANAALVMNGPNFIGFGSLNPVVGSLAGTGAISLPAGGSFIVGNNGSNTTYSGVLSGPGSFAKTGAGSLTLMANHTHTNVTVISNGSLVLGATGSLSNSPVVLAGGTFDVTAFSPFTPPAGEPLMGTGTVSGNVAIVDSTSRLLPGTDGTPGTLTVAGNLTLNAAYTNAFDFTNNVTMGGGINDLLVVNGGLEPNGSVVRINQLSLLDNGTYRLVNYTGAKTTSFSTNIVRTPSHKTWTINEATTGQVDLVISGTYGNLRWNSTVSTNWDTTDANWFDMTTLVTNNFLTFDSVLFDDNGAYAPSVNLATSVQPSTVVVNSSSNYSITGSGKITGATGLTKDGTGTLTLGGTGSDYTGTVLITNGILKLASSTALGSRNTGTIINGGTLDINGTTNIAGDILTIFGNGFANTGTVINSGVFADRAIRAITLGSDASIASYGNVWHIRGTNLVDLAGFTLTKLGGGQVFIVEMTLTNAGNINVAAGTLSIARGVTTGSGVIGVAAGAALSLENYSSGYFDKSVALTNAVFRLVGNSMTTTTRVSVTGSSTVDVANAISLGLVNPVTGSGSLTKANAGTLVFKNTNTYAGATTIASGGGTLILNSVTGPIVYGPVQLGTAANGGGTTLLVTSNNNMFASGVSIGFGGSPGDWAQLKLVGTTQTVDSITSDDNGGGDIENALADNGVNSDGLLVIAGSGNSIFSGSIMRDSIPPSTSTGKLRITQAGSGTLTLAGAGTNMTFTGGVIVSNGTLNLKALNAAGVGTVTLAGGVLALNGAGLQEGSFSGAGINTNSPNPLTTGVKLSTKRANMTTDFTTNTTWAYTGYLVVTGTTAVTYTFAENVDDAVWLKIDSTVVLNNSASATPSLGSIGLAPGMHRFDLRAYNGASGGGPINSSWWTNTAFGVGYDPLGRDQADLSNYQALADTGSGMFLCTDVTITNDIFLAADSQINVSNAIGPTNTVGGLVNDGGSGFGITKTGAGILRLAGADIYAGSTTVSNGTLLIDGQHFGAGAITVQSNATLWGTGTVYLASVAVNAGANFGARSGLATNGTFTVTNVVLASGSTLHVLLNGTNPTVRVTGDITSSSSVAVKVVPLGPVALGTHVLVDYDTSFTGATGDFILGTLPNGSQGYLTNNPANTSLDLVITNLGSGIKWFGSVNSSWDVGVTANWKSIADNATTAYSLFDNVTFDDTATGNYTVFLAQTVSPASIVLTNDVISYTFTGADISGGIGLNKAGAAKVTLNNANTYTGTTVISSGTLAILADSSLGAPPSSATAGHLTINAGTTLELLTNAAISATRRIAIGPSSGSGSATISVPTGSTVTASSIIANNPGGTGTFIKAGSGTLIPAAFNTYSGGTVIDGGLVQINLAGSATAANNVFPAGRPLTVQNGSTLRLVGGTAIGQDQRPGGGNPSVVTISVARVTTVANTHQDLPAVVMNAGALSSEGGGDIHGNYIMDGSSLTVLPNAGTSVIDTVTMSIRGGYGGSEGPVTFNVGDGAAEMDLLVSGALINQPGTIGRLIKSGAGTIVLSGTNAYTGYTTINEGTLQVGTNGLYGVPGTGPVTNNARLALSLAGGTVSNLISGTGLVVKVGSGTTTLTAANTYGGGTQISNGTLVVNGAAGSGPATISSGATLGGTGTVAGTVTSDGTVSPGLTAIGQLTVGAYAPSATGALNVQIATNTGTAGTDYDQLNVTGTATLDGILNVTIVDTNYAPVSGDSFFIVNAGGGSGAFATTNMPPLTPGLTWDVTYVGGIVILSVTNGATPPPTGYNAWSNLNALAQGPEGDDDGDGYANLLEYVTGANPTNNASTSPMSASRTNGNFALHFTRDTNSVDATLIVEGSYAATNAAPWLGIATNTGGSWGAATNVSETGSSPVNVTVFDTTPAATNRFLRLRVTRP